MAAPCNTSSAWKKAKHVFSNEEKGVLLEAYRKGMISARHPLVDKTAQELNLDKKLIKTWVNNHNRFVQDRPRTKTKFPSRRGQSSYNIFMEGKRVDHNSPEANLSAHAKMWNALAPEAKEAYQKQAVDRKKNGPPPPASGQERKKRISRLLKSLNPVFVQLVDLGVDVCGHAFGPDYYAFFGSDDGQRFALSHQLQNKLLKFMDPERDPEKEGTNLAMLRKEVRAVFNEAFSVCIDKPNSRVPYQSIRNGSHFGVTMPEGIPFKDPQALSIASLKTIRDKGVTFFRLPEGEPHPDEDHSSTEHSSINDDDILDASRSPTLDAAAILQPLAEGGFLPLDTTSLAGSEPQSLTPGEILDPAAILQPLAEGGFLPLDTTSLAGSEPQSSTPGEILDPVTSPQPAVLPNRYKRKIKAPKRLIENASSCKGAITKKKDGNGKIKAQKTNEISEDVYYLERVIKERRKKGKLECLVKWKNYPEEQATWEPKKNVYI